MALALARRGADPFIRDNVRYVVTLYSPSFLIFIALEIQSADTLLPDMISYCMFRKERVLWIIAKYAVKIKINLPQTYQLLW